MKKAFRLKSLNAFFVKDVINQNPNNSDTYYQYRSTRYTQKSYFPFGK